MLGPAFNKRYGENYTVSVAVTIFETKWHFRGIFRRMNPLKIGLLGFGTASASILAYEIPTNKNVF